MPAIENLLGGEARFNLRKCRPIAIVVVTGIVMPDNDRLIAFIRRAEILLVPVHDQLLTVRILRRHEHDNDIVQDRLDARRVFGRQLVADLLAVVQAFEAVLQAHVVFGGARIAGLGVAAVLVHPPVGQSAAGTVGIVDLRPRWSR